MENGDNGVAHANPQRCPISAKKRTSIFRAVVLAFRGHSSKKASVTTADTVIKTLGGMRPLHCSLAYQLPAPPPPPPDVVLDAYYDVRVPPSPCRSAPMSRYSSAEDLQLLDTIDDEEDGSGEPNAIDMKAEEFIAMFYKQMRLQMLDEKKATVGKSQDLPMIPEENVNVRESAGEAETSHQ